MSTPNSCFRNLIVFIIGDNIDVDKIYSILGKLDIRICGVHSIICIGDKPDIGGGLCDIVCSGIDALRIEEYRGSIVVYTGSPI